MAESFGNNEEKMPSLGDSFPKFKDRGNIPKITRFL